MFTVSGFVCFSNSAYVCAQSGVSFSGYGFVQVMHSENFKNFFFLCSLGRIRGTQHQNRGQAKGKERFCTLALTTPVIIFPVHAKSVNDYCN